MRSRTVLEAARGAWARKGEDIMGEGVVRNSADGFGFLRSAATALLAEPDDIYVSPCRSGASTCAPR